MRHIYEFHHYPISEDLLLALGAGVGFVYWHMKGTLPFFGGRANAGRPGEEGLEKTAGRRTGVRVESYRTASGRKAEAAVLDQLTAGEPVMVQLDMGFLPYLWYTFDFSHKHPPTPREVKQAIREVATGMLKPPIANLGVKGIRTAAERILKWPKIMDEDELRYACPNVFIFIDARGGSGGGIFRYMYGRFLKEAAAITGDERLAEAGEEIHVIGDHWQQAAQIFERSYTAPNSSTLLPEASRLILENRLGSNYGALLSAQPSARGDMRNKR